jgi:uncharacterized membrane protein YgcG
MTPLPPASRSRWYSLPLVIGFAAFAAIGGFFLYTEHKAHLFGALPWLLILLCPLMHVFMHGRHGSHGGHGGHSAPGGQGDHGKTGGSGESTKK